MVTLFDQGEVVHVCNLLCIMHIPLDILFVNFTAFGLDDGLQPAPEGLTHVHDVVPLHGPPLVGDGAPQVVDTTVADTAGPALNVPPDAEVQGVEVRALWRPGCLRPELHVLLHPLLDDIGRVGRGAVLLEHIGRLARLLRDLGDLWGHLGLQNIQVVGGREPVSSGEPHWWHFVTG